MEAAEAGEEVEAEAVGVVASTVAGAAVTDAEMVPAGAATGPEARGSAAAMVVEVLVRTRPPARGPSQDSVPRPPASRPKPAETVAAVVVKAARAAAVAVVARAVAVAAVVAAVVAAAAEVAVAVAAAEVAKAAVAAAVVAAVVAAAEVAVAVAAEVAEAVAR